MPRVARLELLLLLLGWQLASPTSEVGSCEFSLVGGSRLGEVLAGLGSCEFSLVGGGPTALADELALDCDAKKVAVRSCTNLCSLHPDVQVPCIQMYMHIQHPGVHTSRCISS